MIGILIVGHGEWPIAMKKSAEMIVGTIEGIEVQEVTEVESAEIIVERIEKKLERLSEYKHIVVLVDLFGGSPSHAIVKLSNKDRVTAITGVNLGMLLELIMIRNDMNAIEAAEQIIESGKKGIINIFQALNEYDKEQEDDFHEN